MLLLRWLLVPALVLPVGWVLFQGLGRDPRAVPSPLIGQPAPAFELVGVDGRSVDSATLLGRVVIVNFWASWCFECIEEHRVLLEAQEQYREDLVIIGILYEDRVEDALAFLVRYGDGGWPNLIDPNGAVALEYGVFGPPESFFIDADGLVRYKLYGPVTWSVLDAQLPTLLLEITSTRAEVR